MDNYLQLIQSDEPMHWEESYLSYVTSGQVGIDEWVLDWIANRFCFPESQEYSIFSPNVLIDNALLNVRFLVNTRHQGRNRYLYVAILQTGDLHPTFEYLTEPNPENQRFESVGNPLIDTPNYRIWEEYLACSLLAEALFEQKALDAFIEAIHRHR